MSIQTTLKPRKEENTQAFDVNNLVAIYRLTARYDQDEVINKQRVRL